MTGLAIAGSNIDMVVPPGVEPGTSRVSDVRSNQLNYGTIVTTKDERDVLPGASH
jgi:hypothetical protein